MNVHRVSVSQTSLQFLLRTETMKHGSEYKRLIMFYKQKYIIPMTIKLVHLPLLPAQNKMYVE